VNPLIQKLPQAAQQPLRRVVRGVRHLMDKDALARDERLAHDLRVVQDALGRLAGEVHNRLGEVITSSGSFVELSAYLGRTLRELRDTVPAGPAPTVTARRVEELDRPTAELLDFAMGPSGFAAQAGLRFDPVVGVAHGEQGVRVTEVSERVVEVPYALRALAGLAPGAAVVDVGSAGSTLALSLASLGYAVTAYDTQPYPLSHPNLRVASVPLDQWNPGSRFDALVALSSLPRLGEGSADAEARAMKQLRAMARPGALLVLSVPYGASGSGAVGRSYDAGALARLLEGWTVTDRSFAHRVGRTAWMAGEGQSQDGSHRVAMVTARLS
jgi:hypothetical protein